MNGIKVYDVHFELVILAILAVIASILSYLLIREYRRKKVALQEEREKDKLLTKTIAENLDLEKELSEIKAAYTKQQDMAKEIQNMQVQSRLLKHDMKNHTLVILSYLEAGKTEEAKNYTSNIFDGLNKMYTYINVGNSLLNYILNSKLSKAKELGIEIKAEIENLAFDYMDSVDFSALLNNLLDNAIYAADNSKEKNLEIVIVNQNGFDSIVVKNSIDKSVLEENPELKSTKQGENHGFGILQIKKITEKYQGMIDIYEKNNLFIINVVYPC